MSDLYFKLLMIEKIGEYIFSGICIIFIIVLILAVNNINNKHGNYKK